MRRVPSKHSRLPSTAPPRPAHPRTIKPSSKSAGCSGSRPHLALCRVRAGGVTEGRCQLGSLSVSLSWGGGWTARPSAPSCPWYVTPPTWAHYTTWHVVYMHTVLAPPPLSALPPTRSTLGPPPPRTLADLAAAITLHNAHTLSPPPPPSPHQTMLLPSPCTPPHTAALLPPPHSPRPCCCHHPVPRLTQQPSSPHLPPRRPCCCHHPVPRLTQQPSSPHLPPRRPCGCHHPVPRLTRQPSQLSGQHKRGGQPPPLRQPPPGCQPPPRTRTGSGGGKPAAAPKRQQQQRLAPVACAGC